MTFIHSFISYDIYHTIYRRYERKFNKPTKVPINVPRPRGEEEIIELALIFLKNSQVDVTPCKKIYIGRVFCMSLSQIFHSITTQN